MAPKRKLRSWQGAEVLVLSPTPTHPQDYGNRKRIFSVCSGLVERGARITFVHYPAESEWRTRIPAAASMASAWHVNYVVPVTRPLHATPKALDHTVDEWWDEAIGQFLAWLFKLSQFDVFIVNYTWLSKAFEAAPPSVLKILDTHDRFGGRRAVLEKIGVGPEYFHTTEDDERIAVNRADIVWAIKDEERRYFEQLTTAPVITLSHLDAVSPVSVPEPDFDGILRIGIIGARNNVNLLNLKEFLTAAIPMFERFFAPIRIYVAGSVCDLLRGIDTRFVRLFGRVKDVDEFYRSVDLICIPIRLSTGLKIKTGEAISLGVPVISLAHGFEGYFACHPFHTLRDFADMADRLVDIAFDRSMLAGLRDASIRAAELTARGIDDAIEETWRIIEQRRRRIVFCVASYVFEARSPESSAFLSTLRFLTTMEDVVVLVVAGSLEPLLTSNADLDSRATIIIDAALVETSEDHSALRARGYGIATAEGVFGRFSQTLVIVDALSEQLLQVRPVGVKVIFRAEMVAQSVALGRQFQVVGEFLKKFSDPVIMAPRSSPVIGALAGVADAEIVRCPCCWRSADAPPPDVDHRQRGRVLLLIDGKLRGLPALLDLLDQHKLKPVLVVAAGSEPNGSTEADARHKVQYLEARNYLSQICRASMGLPEFFLDLSFGAPGLQYLREIMLRFDVRMISAEASIPHSFRSTIEHATIAFSYEAMASMIVSAAGGSSQLHREQRLALKTELSSDAGWSWLSRNGFDVLDG